MARKRLLWILVAGLAVGFPLGWFFFGQRTVPEGQPPLSNLASAALDAFREDFNRAAGHVRVIVLLSPT